MKSRFVKAAISGGGVVLCSLIASGVSKFLSATFSHVWHLSLGVTAVFVAFLALQLCRRAKWQGSDFIIGLLVVECVLLITTVLLPFALFNGWRWFANMSLFTAPAWLLGYGVGSISLTAEEQHKPVFVRSWVLAALFAICGVVALGLIPHLRHVYAEFAAPLPKVTLLLIRTSPEIWFFAALGLGGATIWKDLVFRRHWTNLILPIPLVLVTVALLIPLL